MPVAARHLAAVAALELDGTESVLEIGCGTGVAVRLVLEQLTTGSVTALDRSAKMIAAVEKLSSKKLRTRAEALEDADFGRTKFDAIFAVNVDLQLRLGTRWPAMIAKLLKKKGRLVLAFEAPPGSDKARAFAATTCALLVEAGFAVEKRPVRAKVSIIRARVR